MYRFNLARYVLIIFCSILGLVNPSHIYASNQGNPTLTLKEAILLAMRNNPNIRNAELQRVVDKFSLAVAHNQFTPQIMLTGNAFFQKGSKGGSYSAFPSVSLLTPLGTQINTSLTHVLNNEAEPPFTTDLQVVVTQPLLRGFGTAVNKAPWRNATDSEKIAQIQFKEQVITILINVVNAFYQLVQSYNNLRVDKLSLNDSQTTLNQTIAKINAGKAAPADKIQQESNIASQELAISTDENTIRQNYQSLLTLLGLDPEAKIHIDQTIQHQRYPIPSLEKSIEIATIHNLAYQQALLAFNMTERALVVAKNNQLWELNATLTVDQPVGNNDPSATGARSLSFDLDVPIRDLARKQELVNAKIQLQQNKTNLEQLKRQLVVDVTNAYYNVKFSIRQVELSQNALKLAQQSLDIAKIKFKYGKTTSFELTSLQTALTSAQLSYIAQQIGYFNTIEAFYQLLGTTLEKWNIVLSY